MTARPLHQTASDPEAIRDAARVLAHRQAARLAMQALVTAGIDVMPLKGVWLAFEIYDQASTRLGVDVDLLVRSKDFARATEVLVGAGFLADENITDPRERSLIHPKLSVAVDLHQALFPAFRFNLSTSDLFRRGRPNRTLFDVPVSLPDPYDGCCHAIGHFASDHSSAQKQRLAGDLELLAKHFDLRPSTAAKRLRRAGLHRAAAYSRRLLGDSSPFLTETHRRLDCTPTDDAIACGADWLTRTFPVTSVPSKVAGHLINRSLVHTFGAGLVGVFRHATARSKRRGIRAKHR